MQSLTQTLAIVLELFERVVVPRGCADDELLQCLV
jgi:hypothetical protein